MAFEDSPGSIGVEDKFSTAASKLLVPCLNALDRSMKLIPTAMAHTWICVFDWNRAPAPDRAGRSDLLGASTSHLVDVRCIDSDNVPSSSYQRPRLSTHASDGTRNP